MANAPLFAPTPFSKNAQATVANPNRDGTGTIVTLHTGSSSGAGFSRLDRTRIQAAGPTTAGKLRLFLKKSGGSFRLFKEYDVPAKAAGDEPWSVNIDHTLAPDTLYLNNGDVLGFAPSNGETFNGFCFGGDT